MGEEILINVTQQETRVALVENGVLQEVFIERASRHGIVGNIYQGKVSRVLPGMQAAFIDVGLDRTAFLHVNDIAWASQQDEHDAQAAEGVQQIQDVLHDGQELLVQVVKDPLGTKGARLTTHVSLPSRYLVFMPGSSHVGVSSKIESEAERKRLREAVSLQAEKHGGGGYIVRTAGEGASQEAIWADMLFLNRLWEAIGEKARDARAGELVHGDLPLVLRIVRDLLRAEVETVRIDSAEAFEQVQQFAASFFPHLASRVEYYNSERPIFDLYGVEDEILRALNRKVELKSGGHLIFDQTEAMTTVDVNTGAFVGHRTLEETIFKTNLEAVQAIARQLRLRNIGGIIIIDFIDMLEEQHQQQVLKLLARTLEKDQARARFHDISPLGLVEMTRKRTRESLEHVLCEPCPTCNGKGTTRTVETMVYEIFREIVRADRQFEASRELMVLAAPSVIDLLNGDESSALAEIEAQINKPIRLQSESQYNQEQFDVVLL